MSESEASPEPHFSEPPAFAVPNSPQYAEPYADQDRYDETLYGRIDPAQAPSTLPPGDAYSNDPYDYQDPYGDGTEAPNLKPRRGGMLTVVAVLALAVVGTGAAFGYRTYMGSSRSGEPPVIKADAGPTKVVPAPAADASGKQIQDRLGGGSGTEKLVSREEQPIDPTATSPRVVLPQMNQIPNQPAPSAMVPSPRAPAGRLGNGTLGGDEPRKIQTFAVRPDNVDSAAVPVAPAARPTATRNPAPAAPRNPPAPIANANASAGNAPLSLSPQAVDAPRPATRLASAPAAQHTAGAGGDYLVQISSQRSEAEARSSFRTLQGKFPSVLGSHPPLIKRADLGDKGVYYRAMVGPFGSPEEASQFCGSLKSAGGQCVVQRN
ncbi:SPOR domain-containing protein [Rhodopseudomonas sp.]|uniref:SPOR domain-containing protein n=1 Tax=Rhodopseudomonas sp. TaxID=1078 RepID=UPI0034566537